MFAVIEVWGNQFIVRKWDIIEVKKQDFKDNSKIVLEALLVSDDEGENTKIWTPNISWSKVELKILEQFKGEKIKVFKMKSKKRYARNKWFKPSLTKLEVLSVE